MPEQELHALQPILNDIEAGRKIPDKKQRAFFEECIKFKNQLPASLLETVDIVMGRLSLNERLGWGELLFRYAGQEDLRHHMRDLYDAALTELRPQDRLLRVIDEYALRISAGPEYYKFMRAKAVETLHADIPPQDRYHIIMPILNDEQSKYITNARGIHNILGIELAAAVYQGIDALPQDTHDQAVTDLSYWLKPFEKQRAQSDVLDATLTGLEVEMQALTQRQEHKTAEAARIEAEAIAHKDPEAMDRLYQSLIDKAGLIRLGTPGRAWLANELQQTQARQAFETVLAGHEDIPAARQVRGMYDLWSGLSSSGLNDQARPAQSLAIFLDRVPQQQRLTVATKLWLKLEERSSQYNQLGIDDLMHTLEDRIAGAFESLPMAERKAAAGTHRKAMLDHMKAWRTREEHNYERERGVPGIDHDMRLLSRLERMGVTRKPVRRVAPAPLTPAEFVEKSRRLQM